MKSINLISFILAITIQGCTSEKSENKSQLTDTIVDEVEIIAMDTLESINSSNSTDDYSSDEDVIKSYITKLNYQNFSVFFHGFGSSEFDNEEPDNSFIESDTTILSEDLDDRINNTLIQIIPTNKNDMFVVSIGYISSLNEIIDERNHSQEDIKYFYDNWKANNEKTKTVPIKDSANYFFRALPHTPDMEEVTVVNGKVVPVKKGNTQEQINYERKFYQDEIVRIKNKYKLKDTLVVIPGEYNTVATLTKNKKLFGYNYDSFLFRIDRYNDKKLLESKYIIVHISYGC